MAVPYPQLVLLGDSLFQFCVNLQDGFSFQAALQSHCSRRLDVINRGFSGYNTKNVVGYLDQLFPKPTDSSAKIEYLVRPYPSKGSARNKNPNPNPKPQVILLGANDSCLPLPTKAQHVPIDDYKANLVKIITHPSIQAHQPKILLVTPPPVDEIKLARLDVAAGHESATRKSAVTAAYGEKVREIAREHPGVEVIDLWQVIMDKAISMTPGDHSSGGPLLGSPENGNQGGLDSLLPDGLHMSGPAYKAFFEAVLPHVGREWTQTPQGGLSDCLFPDWKTLNIEPPL
jgi:lysophospholipase L1-like esterase